MYSEKVEFNKTTRLLYWSMFKLLKDRTFDEVTVNDLCKEALVSRSTFYSYFQDKYHLLLFCLDQERERLGIIKGVDIYNNLVSFLNRIKEEGTVYKNLFFGQTNKEALHMITERFNELTEYNLSKTIDDEEELEVLSVLYSTGLAGTIMWWIKNDFHLEVEKLAKYQYETMERM